MDNSRIKLERKKLGLSQTELGRLIGVSQSAVGMYEQNRRSPDTETLLKLAKVFDVSVDYLINASEVTGKFDIDSIAKDVASNLIDNDTLMFNATCYTKEELNELTGIIEQSVKLALNKRLGNTD